MAKFWPLHHYNQCMGENRRKTLSTARGPGVCQPDIFTKYRLRCGCLTTSIIYYNKINVIIFTAI